MRGSDRAGVLLVTLAGAALRFATLDVQSFGDAETFTVLLVRMGLAEMWSEIPRLEGTPPLYYLLAWAWAKGLGSGEAELRSLSALVSTATIPVAWAAARTVIPRAGALAAAGLVAVNPLLIWYAQEARAYALLGLLSAVALLFFLRQVTGRGRPNADLAGWAVASALGVATHYFAALLVVPQAMWLLWAGPRRAALAASAAPLLTALALIPVAVDQTDQAGGGEPELASLGVRLARVPKQFLVGFNVPWEGLLTAIAALALAAAGLLAARRRERLGRAGVPAAVGLAGFALLVLLALVGPDYVLSRYLVLLVVPFAIAAGAALAADRRGAIPAAALAVVSLVAVMAVNVEPQSQRPDYRGSLARANGVARAVVISSVGARLEVFRPGLRPMPGTGRRVTQLDVIGLVVVGGDVRERPRPATYAVPRRGFRLAGVKRTEGYVLLRYRARRPTPVSPLVFFDPPPGPDPALMLYEPGSTG